MIVITLTIHSSSERCESNQYFDRFLTDLENRLQQSKSVIIAPRSSIKRIIIDVVDDGAIKKKSLICHSLTSEETLVTFSLHIDGVKTESNVLCGAHHSSA
jgi:hypothetical protein